MQGAPKIDEKDVRLRRWRGPGEAHFTAQRQLKASLELGAREDSVEIWPSELRGPEKCGSRLVAAVRYIAKPTIVEAQFYNGEFAISVTTDGEGI